MTEEQIYLFDLQGYVVIKGVVPTHVIEACNKALDRFENMPPNDFPPPLCLERRKQKRKCTSPTFWRRPQLLFH